jgi:hypothetical protein
MICALCQQDRQLQKSHIISEFLYAPLYDENHRFNVLTVRAEDTNRIEQKGARERLLCGDCEQLLSRYERYASLVIKGGAPNVTAHKDGAIIFLAGVDYKLFKLFQLSLLWRAVASKLEFFERVQLGSHLDRIGAMLLEEDPGPFNLYPCLMWGITLEPGKTPGLMIQPGKLRVMNYTTYQFVFGGLVWVYFVSSQKLTPPYSQFVLQQDGTATMQVRSALELPSLNNFMAAFDGLGRAPRLEV